MENLGQKRIRAITEQGEKRGMTFQVAEVERTLASVSNIVAAGHKVVFDENGSYIERKSTRQKTWLNDANCVYSLEVGSSRLFTGMAAGTYRACKTTS